MGGAWWGHLSVRASVEIDLDNESGEGAERAKQCDAASGCGAEWAGSEDEGQGGKGEDSGSTSTPWAIPQSGARALRPRWMPPHSPRPHLRPRRSRRSQWIPPGSTWRWVGKGTADGGIYKFTVARNQAITTGATSCPPDWG